MTDNAELQPLDGDWTEISHTVSYYNVGIR